MRALILILLMVALIQTASAYEYADLGNVKTASYEVPQGYVIYSVYANDIPLKPNEEWSTQTFILNAFGQKYTLTVKGRAEGTFGVYKHFYVNLTYPNGTIDSRELKQMVLLSNKYDIKIQYYPVEYNYNILVSIFISPFDAQIGGPSEGFGFDNFVLFNQVIFTSDQEAHLKIYYATTQEWQNRTQREIYPWEFGQPTGANVSVTLDCREIAQNVPLVGSAIETYLCPAMDVAGQSVGLVMDTFYWFKLIFIDNGLLLFTLFEALTLAYSALQSRDIFQFYRRYVGAHKAMFEFIVDMLRKIIQIFTSIIQAIGSLIPFT